MCSTPPPQPHVQVLTSALNLAEHPAPLFFIPCGIVIVLLVSVTDSLPMPFYLSTSLPQSSRMQIGCDRAIVKPIRQGERNGSAKINGRIGWISVIEMCDIWDCVSHCLHLRLLRISKNTWHKSPYHKMTVQEISLKLDTQYSAGLRIYKWLNADQHWLIISHSRLNPSDPCANAHA